MASLAMQEWGSLVQKLGAYSQPVRPSLRTAVSVEIVFSRNGVRQAGVYIADLNSPFALPNPISFSADRNDKIQIRTYVQWMDPGGLTTQLRRLRTTWPYTIDHGICTFTRDSHRIMFYYDEELLARLRKNRNWSARPQKLFENVDNLTPRFTRKFVWAGRTMRLAAHTRYFASRDSSSRGSRPHSRPNNEDTSLTMPVLFYQYNGVTSSKSSSTKVIPQVLYRSRTRVNTPNFFRLRKSERPINFYSMTEIVTRPSLGYQRVRYTNGGLPNENFWVVPAEWAVNLPASGYQDSSQAESRAFAQLIDAMGNEPFGLAQDLVQFRQTTDLITSNLTRVAKAYLALRRGKFSDAANELFDNRPPRYRTGAKPPSLSQSIATNWLELQYGWKPLLSDIDILIKKVHVEFRDYLRTARSSATARSETNTPVLGPFSTSLNGVPPYTVGYINRAASTRVKYGIRYRITSKDRQFLAQAGITNPINLAWELLPYSFVVDWAYPIGPYLERLTAFEGMTFVDGWKSRLYQEYIFVNISDSRTVGLPANGGPWEVDVRFSTARKSTVYVREVLPTFPRQPAIALKSPVSAEHALNALALLKSAFGGTAGSQTRFRT